MKTLLTVLAIFVIQNSINAQITGLWEVVNVQVGNEKMTPVAKWTYIHEDGSYTSGNGWLQNSDGNWNYDEETSKIEMTPKTGFDDPDGPFNIMNMNEDSMIWTREEGGEEVIVSYNRISQLPKSLPDLAIGIWDIETAEKDGLDVMSEIDPTGNRFVFLRFDHLVFDVVNENRTSGMWRIDAHRPVIDILYYDTSKSSDYWQITFDGEDTMQWTKDDLIIKFSRLTSFPD